MALMRDSTALGAKPILKIVTLEIPVRDLERAVAWYQRALGLEVAATNGRSVMMRVPAGEGGEGGPISLFLVETNDARRLGFCSTGTGIVHNVIDFLTPDLAGLHARLKAMKAEVDVLKPGATGFGFRDPDGNRLGACDSRP